MVLHKWALISGVTFNAVVLCCLITTLLSQFGSFSQLTDTLTLRLFYFTDDVLPRIVHAVIAVDTAARVTLNSSAVFVTDTPANRGPMICPIARSLESHISPMACVKKGYNMLKNNLKDLVHKLCNTCASHYLRGSSVVYVQQDGTTLQVLILLCPFPVY